MVKMSATDINRVELKKKGQNICFGETCGNKTGGGVVKQLSRFVTGLNTCVECVERRELRKSLKSNGQNICFGSLCNGKIHDLNDFSKNSLLCKKCHNLNYEPSTTRIAIREYRSDKCCVECGESDYRLIEFDHIDEKEKSFNIASNSFALETIFKEIEKTQFLCIECHRKKTYFEKERTHDEEGMLLKYSYTEEEAIIKTEPKICNGHMCKGKMRDISMFGMRNRGTKYMPSPLCIKCSRYKNLLYHIKCKNHVKQRKIKIGKCAHCEKKVTEDNFFIFDFDHLRDKLYTIAKMIGRAPIKRIDEEIDKCQLLCCKCHKLKTAKQLNYRYDSAKS
jgi:hypothetical protein